MLMNRPIDFRIWHTPTGRMHRIDFFTSDYVYLPWDNAKTDTENYQVVDHPFARKDCVMMQFTGVCDDKGTKIYEGDFVYWCHFDEDMNDLMEAWHEVVFQHGCFGTVGVQGEEFDPFYSLASGDVVVGNIFEQPDLLVRSRAEVGTKATG